MSHLKGRDKKNASINPKNIDDRCFQRAFALTKHHKEINNHPERVSNLKSLFLSI